MMRGVLGPIGTAASAAIPGVKAWGKTGTTSNYEDAWFVGSIPRIGNVPSMTIAVWVGYPDKGQADAQRTSAASRSTVARSSGRRSWSARSSRHYAAGSTTTAVGRHHLVARAAILDLDPRKGPPNRRHLHDDAQNGYDRRNGARQTTTGTPTGGTTSGDRSTKKPSTSAAAAATKRPIGFDDLRPAVRTTPWPPAQRRPRPASTGTTTPPIRTRAATPVTPGDPTQRGGVAGPRLRRRRRCGCPRR